MNYYTIIFKTGKSVLVEAEGKAIDFDNDFSYEIKSFYDSLVDSGKYGLNENDFYSVSTILNLTEDQYNAAKLIEAEAEDFWAILVVYDAVRMCDIDKLSTSHKLVSVYRRVYEIHFKGSTIEGLLNSFYAALPITSIAEANPEKAYIVCDNPEHVKLIEENLGTGYNGIDIIVGETPRICIPPIN